MQGHKQYRSLFLPYETVLELVFQDWYGRSTVSDPEFLYFVFILGVLAPSSQYKITHYHHEDIPSSLWEGDRTFLQARDCNIIFTYIPLART